MRHSFTKLSLYEFCPWAYRYRYVERAPIPFAPRLVVGAIVHSVLKSFFERLRDGLTVGAADLQELHETYWADAPRLDPGAQPEMWKRARALLQGFWSANRERLGRPVLLEARFRVPLGPGGRHTLEGVVDRVDGSDDGAEIIDYKSGRVPAELPQRLRTQLHTYAAALPDAFDLRADRLTAYFLEDNRSISIEPDPGFAADVMERYRTTAEQVGAEQFDPTPGPHCARCDFADRCPYRSTEG